MKIKAYDKIPLIYFAMGAIWIIVSDTIVALFSTVSSEVLLQQTLKGWFYVLVTTLLLRVLVRRHHMRLLAAALEREELYYKIVEGAHHILLNYLNSMQMVIDEADNCAGFDKSVVKASREISYQAAESIQALGELPEPTAESVLNLAYQNIKTAQAAESEEKELTGVG